MSAHGGIELRDIVFESGEDHLKATADIYVDNKKVGELYDDGWCEELYFEFIDGEAEKLFMKKMSKYCIRKNLDISKDVFLGKLLYEGRINMLVGKKKKSNNMEKQISFFE